MPILITLVLVMIGAQILAGLYASINPFVEQLGSIQRYNIAYYGAIAGIERSYLVLRGHEAGFTGSGGFIDTHTYGNSSDFKFTGKKYFGQLSLTGMGNGFFWEIKGLTDSSGIIPGTGQGDLDPDVSSGNDYKRLDFGKALQYAFYKDTTPKEEYYTGVSDAHIQNIKLDNQDLKLSLRAPQKLYGKYSNPSDPSNPSGNMLDKDDDIDLDDDNITNDVIVNRSLFGYTGDTQFTVFPTLDVDYSNSKVNSDDTAIRESNINYYTNTTDGYNIVFTTTTSVRDTNPNEGPNEGGGNTQNVSEFNQSPEGAVGTGFDLLLNNNDDNFKSSKNNNEIGKIHLKLSLVNYLKYDEDHVYPYLEVKLNAGKQIPKLDFDIIGRGKAGEYDVSIKLKKPVFDTTAASDFTVLF